MTTGSVRAPRRLRRSFELVEFATPEGVGWFSDRRLLGPIGNVPRAKAEERYYATLEQSAMRA